MRQPGRNKPVGAAAGVGVCLIMCVAGLQASTAPAYADPEYDGSGGASLEVTDDECPVTGGGSALDGDVLGPGVETFQVSRAATATGPTPGDVVTMSASAKSTVNLQRSGDHLKAASLRVDGRVSVKGAADSDCEPRVSAGGELGISFAVKHPGWIKLEARAPHKTFAIVYVRSDTTGDSAYLVTDVGNPSRMQAGSAYQASALWKVQPGDFVSSHEVGWEGERLDRPDRDAVVGGSGKVSFTVIREGSATGGAKGSGKKYATLPGHRQCGQGKLPIKLTKRARQAKKIEVYAGKKKVASFKGKPGTKKVKLPKKATTIKVIAKLKKGGRATGKRSYRACL